MIAMVGVVIWLGFSAWSIAAFAGVSDDVEADAIIVLGAAAWGSRPSPVFRERINHGIYLYEQGQAGKLIFTGGQAEGDPLSEAEVARDYAVAHGIDPDDILIETTSTSTRLNLLYAKEVAEANNLDSFILVSDPLHMKRAVLIAHDLGLDVYSSPTPTTRYRSTKRQTQFLLRETYFYQKYLLLRPLWLLTLAGA
ncbi:MAG: YdcF family protein [Anaerolineae bacterium]|nr:YdcF family protein [Anaerolineae bacterium]